MNFLLDLRTEFRQSHLLYFNEAGVEFLFELALLFARQRGHLAEQVRDLFFSLRFHGQILIYWVVQVKHLMVL
jgi:hypothetical protein